MGPSSCGLGALCTSPTSTPPPIPFLLNCTALPCKCVGQHEEPKSYPNRPQSSRAAQPEAPRGPTPPHPLPYNEGSPRSGRTLAATNERSRRLREPGRLCPPGIGHAMGSSGRGLGAPRAWLGQACCWVTGRRVSPGNGGEYRSLAGRDGGRARAQAGRADPSNSAAPAPRGAVTFTRAAWTLRTPGRPAAQCILAPRGDPGCRSLSGPGPCGGKLSPSQLLICSFLLFKFFIFIFEKGARSAAHAGLQLSILHPQRLKGWDDTCAALPC